MPKIDQIPYALYRADQIRRLDRHCIEQFGLAGQELMQRAGQAAFAWAAEHWSLNRPVAVLTGTGNNGGDGFVFALAAKAAGVDVQVLQLGDRDQIRGDALHFAQAWLAAGGVWEDFCALPHDCGVIVDAMLGTGLQRAVKGRYLDAIQAINQHSAKVLAIDLPSGLHADTGMALGAAVRADATVTYIGMKQGMLTADGVDCCGQIIFEPLDVPAAIYATERLSARRLDWARLRQSLSPRRRSAHKGHFGHVLVIGGDHGYGGAVRLAAEGALRSGAGLVSVATRQAHVAGMLAGLPEVMVHAVDHTASLAKWLQQASVLVVGPGLGQTAWGRALLQLALQSNRPMVVDADALNLLAQADSRAAINRSNWIMTPHPGEAARLLRVCTADIHADRFAAAVSLQRRFGAAVVLKGAGSVICAYPDKPLAICSDGNPGMASGGMGDALSGVIAGLLAQQWSLQEALELGVCLHAAAADRAAAQEGERGLCASDVLRQLRRLVNGL